MTKQERAEFTIDYIRNRTEGVPDEFLADISIALQEGMRMAHKIADSELFQKEPLDIPTMTTDFVKEHGLPCPEGYIFKDQDGNVINATKIVLEKKKKEYPKTYEECRDYIESCYGEPFCADLIATGYKSKLIESFARLLICRDAYWELAGEEMGLGKSWKPINAKGYCTYAIIRHTGHIRKSRPCADSELLEFPTEEMRDAFMVNFKVEIEICKELL